MSDTYTLSDLERIIKLMAEHGVERFESGAVVITMPSNRVLKSEQPRGLFSPYTLQSLPLASPSTVATTTVSTAQHTDKPAPPPSKQALQKAQQYKQWGELKPPSKEGKEVNNG